LSPDQERVTDPQCEGAIHSTEDIVIVGGRDDDTLSSQRFYPITHKIE
jgi:hypothetical protein